MHWGVLELRHQNSSFEQVTLQCISSLLSGQLNWPSQTVLLLTHLPSLHLNSKSVQFLYTQPISSDLSPQSFSKSHLHLPGIHLRGNRAYLRVINLSNEWAWRYSFGTYLWFAHLKYDGSHVRASHSACGSSSPFGQSLSPSHNQLLIMQRPFWHVYWSAVQVCNLQSFSSLVSSQSASPSHTCTDGIHLPEVRHLNCKSKSKVSVLKVFERQVL